MPIWDRIKQILDAMAYFGGLLAFVTIGSYLIWMILLIRWENKHESEYEDYYE